MQQAGDHSSSALIGAQRLLQISEKSQLLSMALGIRGFAGPDRISGNPLFFVISVYEERFRVYPQITQISWI